MPKKHPLIAQIEARIARKRADLANLQSQRENTANKRDAELAVMDAAILGIEMGIQEDVDMLAGAVPKLPRVRKKSARAENVEEQGGKTSQGD